MPYHKAIPASLPRITGGASLRYRRVFQPVLTALLLVLMGMAWVTFAPIQFGGQAAYVIVNGISMEPGFRRGDLAIVRQAADYAIGDVVTYRHPQIGPIIHRVIGIDGDRLIFKGDNNAWIDGYRPTRAECIGKLWIHIPSAGTFIEQMRTPRNMALLAGALGFIVMATVTSDTDRRSWRPSRRSPLTIRFVIGGRAEQQSTARRPAQAQPRTFNLSGESKEILLFALAALAFAALLLAAFAFTRPILRSVADDIAYEQIGSFSYSAGAPAGVYDSGAVQTGDPVFRQLTDAVTVHFDYRLAADQPAEVRGTYRLTAEIDDASGWKRVIELQPETTFEGACTARGVLDLARVQALIDSFEQQTTLQRQQYTLAIVPLVVLQGTLAGQDVQDTFAPRLEFQFDRLHMQLVKGSGTGDPLKPAQQGLLKHTREEPNTLALLGLTLEVASARRIALAGLALAVGGALLLGLLLSQATRGDAAARIQLKYAPLLIAIRDSDPGAGGPVIDVATIDDLARLAEQRGRMILHATSGLEHRYFVHDGDVLYRYQPEGHADRITAGAEEGAR